MPKKLTQDEFNQRVYNCVGDRYQVISEYQGKTKPVTLHCNQHNIDFQVTAECFMRGSDLRSGGCPQCQQEKANARFEDSRIEVECAYCGKQFIKSLSKFEKSKSGLHFCCREHKDLAQRLDAGSQFDLIRPEHYNDITSNYRKLAFRNYEHKCSICGWDEDASILEVHHIDENREHNELDNLIILCPICHRKISSHKYQLIDRLEIVKL